MEQESEIPRGDLVKALAKAKKAFKPIVKNKQVKAGAYSYSYAELSHILDAITPALNDNDLVISQDVLNESVVTRLMHSSGQFLKSSMPIIASGKTGPQGYASSVTYARRYSVCNLLCISADDDLDAGDVQHEHEKHQDNAVRTQNKPYTGNTPGYDARHQAKMEQPISEPQLKRLWAIAKTNHWSEEDVRRYIDALGLEHTKDLNKLQYDKFISNIETYPKGVGEEQKAVPAKPARTMMSS